MIEVGAKHGAEGAAQLSSKDDQKIELIEEQDKKLKAILKEKEAAATVANKRPKKKLAWVIRQQRGPRRTATAHIRVTIGRQGGGNNSNSSSTRHGVQM
jgi:hypothetical protein